MQYKDRIIEMIEQKQDQFIAISDQVWEFAETRFEEYESANLLIHALESEGFSVEREAGGIKTAFVGSYGSGEPVIAFLGEYDALSGLSQTACNPIQEAIVEGGNGHGCGHNLLGTGALAAAIALRHVMEEYNLPGTVRYYGCPGEEGGSGKTFMVRNGLFADVDTALTWHPGSSNGVMTTSSLANYQVYYRFKGKSSHAAASPHLGRSALDAVELMNVGVNYLREHIIQEARVHYAVTDTGGISPNVVQAHAEVLYLIRAPQTAQVEEIYQRICDIARGAALMTGTTVEIQFDKGCSNLVPNITLEKMMYEKLSDLGVPTFTEEEQKLAAYFYQTLSVDEQKSGRNVNEPHMLSQMVLPYDPSAAKQTMSASTDVGDVSWVVPTVQYSGGCYAKGTPFHSWQMVAQGKTSYALKGMLHAGKVLAVTGAELLTNQSLVQQAKDELNDQLKEQAYICPIPEGIEPSPLKKA